MFAVLTKRARIRCVLGAILLLATLLYLVRLGSLGLWAPDEPRYGQVTAELFSGTHGWPGSLVLHLNGEPYTQKPPLYYWLAAAASTPGGRVSEWSARLPSALAGLVTVFLTWRLGLLLFGARTGLWGAGLLLGAVEFSRLARRVQLDVLLTACVTGALLAWVRLDRGRGGRTANTAALHALMGLAVLTKGPVGLLPLAVIAVQLALERRLRDWRRAAPAWAFVLSLGPGLLWIAAAVSLTPEGFFGEAVVENLLGRFFEGTSHARPFYYFVYQLPISFLPVSLLLPLVWVEWRRAGRRAGPSASDPSRRLLLAWVATYVVFFSLSSGKRGLYMLPAFPALTLLCADAVVSAFARGARAPAWLERGVPGALLALAAAAGALGLVSLTDAAPAALPTGGGAPTRFFVALAVVCAACAGAWIRLGRRAAPGEGRAAALLVGLVATELAVFALLLPTFDPWKSPRPIARAAAALVGPDEPIGLFQHRAMSGGLAFYSGRRVVELESADEVREFFASGGGVIASRERYLERFTAVAPVEIRGSFRDGRRSYVVATPSSRPVQPESHRLPSAGP